MNNMFELMLAGRALKDIFGNECKIVQDAIKTRCIFSLDLSNNKWDMSWRDLAEFFPRIPEDADKIFNDVAKIENRPDDKALGVLVTREGFTDFCIFRGTPIILLVVDKEINNRHCMMIRMITPRTKKNIANVRAMVRYLMKKHYDRIKNTDRKFLAILDASREEIPSFELRYHRSFDDVFIPGWQKKELVNSISKFIERRKWYADHKIPYHFGILLHGPAGTGKSSIIQAIICKWKSNPIYIKSGDMGEAFSKTGWVNSLDTGSDVVNLIISEDIDVSNFTETRKNDETKERVEVNQLGKAINFMDGLDSPQNVIYIFTTNHIDKLDPALIRPGRIDLVLEIGYVNNETMNKFLIFHYGRKLPKGKMVKKNVIFATIQVDVMKGMTFDEVLEKYTE